MIALVLSVVVALLASFGSAAGQSSVVVPSWAANQDASRSLLAPGSAMDSRIQLLIDGVLLSPPVTLTAIAFRRDAVYDSSYGSGSADLIVSLSECPHDALSARAEFEANSDPVPSRRIVVYRGSVTLPASASPVGRTVDFGNPQDVIAISFAVPFVHASGTLCVDIEARRTTGAKNPYWAIDACSDEVAGVVTRIGESCSAVGAIPVGGGFSSASVGERQLVPGSTAIFTGRGTSGSTSAFALGFSPLDIDLSLVGLAPAGCRLRVDAAVSVFGTFRDAGPLPGGVMRVFIPMPTDPGMLGAAFVTQFLELGPSIRTSEGLACQVASAVPGIGMAVVVAEFDGSATPTIGRVITQKAPVIQFERQ